MAVLDGRVTQDQAVVFVSDEGAFSSRVTQDQIVVFVEVATVIVVTQAAAPLLITN